MTLKARVESYIGTFTDTTSLDKWLDQAARVIINLLPLDKALKYSVEVSDTGSGVAITGHRLLDVHKGGYEAIEIPTASKARYADANSLYYATATSPVWYIEAGKLYVVPDGGSGVAVAYPTVNNTLEAITGFPAELEQAVVLFTAIQGRLKQLNAKSAEINSLSFATKTIPTAPDAPSINYTDAEAASIAQVSIGAYPTAPEYTVTLPVVPTVSISAPTAPTLPAAPDFAYVDASAATIAATTIGNFSALPTYNPSLPSVPSGAVVAASAPTAPAAPSFTYTNAATGEVIKIFVNAVGSDFTTLNTIINTDEDLEKAQSQINAIQAKIQDFSSQSELELKRLSDNARMTSDVNLQNALQALNKQVQEYRSKLDLYQAQLDKYKTDLQVRIQEGQLNLGIYESQARTVLQNGLNKFQAEATEYQATVQKVIEQARLDEQRLMEAARLTNEVNLQNKLQKLQGDIQLYRSKLETYMSELDKYKTDVSIAIQNAQNSINIYQAESQVKLQDAINAFNASNTAYQANIQKLIEQARLDSQRLLEAAQLTTNINQQNKLQALSASIQEYAHKLNLYQADIQSYQSQIQEEVARYSQEIQKKTQEHTLMSNELGMLKSEYEQQLKMNLGE